MKRVIITAMMITSTLTLVACGNKLESQLVKTAPMSQSKTGFIVKGVEKQNLENWLLENSNISYRVINEPHQLYEIFNTTAETLKVQFPDAKVERNLFIESRDFKQAREKLNIKSLVDEFKNNKLINNDGDSDETTELSDVDYSTLNECKENQDLAPILQIDPTSASLVEDLKDYTIEIGTVISLSSSKSYSQIENKAVKLAWLVYAPEGSLLGKGFVLGSELNYTPDSIGVYYILAVVQDADNVCTFSQLPVVITKNTPYDTLAAAEALKISNTDMSPFWHLDMVSAKQAWSFSGGAGVKIAVIDSGVNYNHMAISPNIQENPYEIPENGIDDDGNGFVDDYVGYDFLNSDAYPYDDSGHGTHVATTSASHIMGVAPQAKVIPIKALSGAGGDAASLTGAIYYAIDQGAHVINMSLGSYYAPPSFLLEAIIYASSQNITIVTAAGNGHPKTGMGLNTDIYPNYPSSLEVAGLISVAATSDGENLSSYSNFGKKTVDVVAPGGSSDRKIYAGFKENKAEIVWAGMQGTSMAAPVVSGIAALVKGANTSLTHVDTANIVINSGVEVDNYVEVTSSGRLVNALKAVQTALATPFIP